MKLNMLSFVTCLILWQETQIFYLTARSDRFDIKPQQLFVNVTKPDIVYRLFTVTFSCQFSVLTLETTFDSAVARNPF
jgi:hypothetical protein